MSWYRGRFIPDTKNEMVKMIQNHYKEKSENKTALRAKPYKQLKIICCKIWDKILNPELSKSFSKNDLFIGRLI
ncbi:MAG TPA: hypothetical protein PKY81_15850 [bacterium]|nr:hypothetical protein [bacterium]HPN32426.1 hypothetical protein [bacterium]